MNAKFLRQYKRIARTYDFTLRLLMLLPPGCMWEPRARRRDLIAPLELELVGWVPEVGAGTGSNLPIIAAQIGKEGKLFALDLSPGMLAVAREKLARRRSEAELALDNAASLPYRDNMFEAVLHFGGINTFGDKGRAITEMIRVAKPGAKIVIGDGGPEPRKEKTRFGKWLLRQNRLFSSTPPVQLIPQKVEVLGLRDIWRGMFYLLELRKPLPWVQAPGD